MSQGPLSNQNSMGIDPSTLSFSGMRSMDPLQDGMSAANMGNPMAGDSSMAGMLDDSMFSAFDNVPMSLDGTGTFDDADSKGMSALDPSTMHALSTDTPDGVDSNEVNADVQMSGVGAGPLPTGFGAQTMLSGGSTLADFTKRRNWSQKVVEELKDMLHILTPDGQIIYISPSGKALTGHDPEELVGKYIVDYIHPDDSGIFVREFNEAIATGHRLRFFYRFRKEDGTFTIFESHGHPHLTSEPGTYGQHGAVGICRGFFIMSRPYPTKNALLLDSFLEHKIENERLRKRIADLKREEAEDAEETHRNWIKRTDSRSDIAASDDASMSTGLNTTDPDALAMPPPAKPGISKSGLTQRNLEDANAHTQPDSIDDKMARYEGASHIETIEMLTGLRYQEGERSRGISTGDMSPSLIRGDAGIIIPAEKEVRSNDKKKKIKVVDEYVCTDCGTLDSPEWRKGPNGPKTLCNACGLRWAKKEKKRSGNGNSASHVTS